MRGMIHAWLLMGAFAVADTAVAGPLRDTQYECKVLSAQPERGFRCMLHPQAPTNLYIWFEGPPSDARDYSVNQVMAAFVARGGQSIEIRRQLDGVLQQNDCFPWQSGRAGAGCLGWKPVPAEAAHMPLWNQLVSAPPAAQ